LYIESSIAVAKQSYLGIFQERQTPYNVRPSLSLQTTMRTRIIELPLPPAPTHPHVSHHDSDTSFCPWQTNTPIQ
jgi:hypothetical protein